MEACEAPEETLLVHELPKLMYNSQTKLIVILFNKKINLGSKKNVILRKLFLNAENQYIFPFIPNIM